MFSSFDNSSDGSSLGSPASPGINIEDTIKDDALTTLLFKQQTIAEAATDDVPADIQVDSNPGPAVSLDQHIQQVICNIQKLVKLTSKPTQLI